jgi:FAD/FMN-containing dehydrogenase
LTTSRDDFLDALGRTLDESTVFIGNRIPEKSRSDASLSGRDLPLAYLRPDSIEQISSALQLCNEHRIPVVVQGGMTGLAGGANPGPGAVALSLDRFSGIEDIDAAAGTMTLRAGTVLEVAQKAAEEAGFLLPIDLGARGSCQIGGNIATNAGGIRVIRHGVTRDNILGLEAALADGTLISSMNRLRKNNTGYDLKHLFIGSEGTMITPSRCSSARRPASLVCPRSRSCGTATFPSAVRVKASGCSTATIPSWRSSSNQARRATKTSKPSLA